MAESSWLHTSFEHLHQAFNWEFLKGLEEHAHFTFQKLNSSLVLYPAVFMCNMWFDPQVLTAAKKTNKQKQQQQQQQQLQKQL